MTDRIQVGVVGGGIGQGHIQAYQSLPGYFNIASAMACRSSSFWWKKG